MLNVLPERKNHIVGNFLNYDDYDSSQRFGKIKIKKAFRALTEVDILQPLISDLDFRTTNVNAAGASTRMWL